MEAQEIIKNAQNDLSLLIRNMRGIVVKLGNSAEYAEFSQFNVWLEW